MATTKATTLAHTIASTTSSTADLDYAKTLNDTGVTSTEFDKLDGLTATTTELNLVDGSVSGPLSHRNMIINGAMQVHQRLAVNTEVTATSSGTFSADRFRFWSNVGSSLPESQVRNDDAPAGFNYSWKRTTNSASSIASSSYDAVLTKIEGYDIANLNFGTSNAKTVTFSFYVKSSIAGTFSLMFANAGIDRVLLKEYTVNSANTWERKTITFTGATDGTWNIGNGIGLFILFGLGYGSNYTSSTTNSWLSSGKYQTTSSTTAIATTNGATFQLTGLQLELGSVATPFEHRSYGDELLKCLRYYYKLSGSSGPFYNYFLQYSSGYRMCIVDLKVRMRATPAETITVNGSVTTYEYGPSPDHWKAYIAKASTETQSYYLTAGEFDAEL